MLELDLLWLFLVYNSPREKNLQKIGKAKML